MPSKRFWAKQNPELDYEETVTKTKNILLDFKFEKIIHISSVSARCQLNTVYGKNKKISEELIQKTKDYLIVRFSAMYGKGLTKGVLIDMINNNKVYINGKSKYSFTDVSWNAKWIVDNLDSKEKSVEIGVDEFIKNNKESNKFICHLEDNNRLEIFKFKNQLYENKDTCILIGPEGDFTLDEIDKSKNFNFEAITLGKSRLRTETAGIVACHLLNIVNIND